MRESFVDLVQDLACSVGYTNLHVGLIYGDNLRFLVSASLYTPKITEDPKNFCLYGLYLLIFNILEIKTETFFN